MRVHAIIIALNEADFIQETIKPLYEHCSGISVITQYDRDYRGRQVEPDETVQKVLSFPDPNGKIHLVVRRYNDETASRNHEMMSLLTKPHRNVQPHAWDYARLQQFHEPPDYFLIVDADEIYDIDTFPGILHYLQQKKPRGMIMKAYEYGASWRFRVPESVFMFSAFGFIRAGVMFRSRRVVSWTDSRLERLLNLFFLPGHWAKSLCGFGICPPTVGVFHHGAYIRSNRDKLHQKLIKHSESGVYFGHDLASHTDRIHSVLTQRFDQVDLLDLPTNIRNGKWPDSFLADDLDKLLGELLPNRLSSETMARSP
jgi:hypothetical protein